MRRFYAPKGDFANGQIMLSIEESHHLRDVLRLSVGDEVSVFDGEGGEFQCTIETIGKKETTLSIVRKTDPSSPESPIEITLAAVVVTGDKFDLVIQKAVELGVTNFIPLRSIRCEAQFKGADKRLVRWRRIGLDAAKQCGRARLMLIENISDLVDFLQQQADGERYFFSERDGDRMPDGVKPKKLTAVIGPKGGWEDSELVAARENGFSVLTLGGRILRAETAAIALTAILQHRFGDIN